MGTKPRAQGSDVIQLIGKEAVYGTPPDGSGGGVYVRLPMRSDDASASQPLEDDPNWNLPSPDDSDPSLGALDVSGNIVAPMSLRGVGLLLTMGLGAPVSAETEEDSGIFLHTWKSGQDLFSYAKQVGHPKLTTPKWRTQVGGMSNGFQFPMARNGRAVMTMPMVFQQELKDATGARDAAPLLYDYLPFDNARGGILVDDEALASVTGAQCNFSNGLDIVEDIRPDMAIGGADPTRRTCSGTATVRFGADTTIDDLVDSTTPTTLAFNFAIGSNEDWWLKFTLHRVFFERTKAAVTGPGGIEQATNWRAAYDSDAGCMMTVTLQNDVESY